HVAAQVAGERRAGTLEQLRTTPLDPLSLVCGLILGAPSRIYLLCVGPLALHIGCGLAGVVPLDTLVETLVGLLSGGVASCLVGFLVALAPRHDSGGALLAAAVAALLGICGLVANVIVADREAVRWGFFHPAGGLSAALLSHAGLWRSMVSAPWGMYRYED